MSDIFGFFSTINEDPEKSGSKYDPMGQFQQDCLQTSGIIYGYVSYAVLLQETMEQDFVMCENITTESCLRDAARIFPGG